MVLFWLGVVRTGWAVGARRFLGWLELLLYEGT